MTNKGCTAFTHRLKGRRSLKSLKITECLRFLFSITAPEQVEPLKQKRGSSIVPCLRGVRKYLLLTRGRHAVLIWTTSPSLLIPQSNYSFQHATNGLSAECLLWIIQHFLQILRPPSSPFNKLCACVFHAGKMCANIFNLHILKTMKSITSLLRCLYLIALQLQCFE